MQLAAKKCEKAPKHTNIDMPASSCRQPGDVSFRSAFEAIRFSSHEQQTFWNNC
jgi:hypothetical protein